ncbi:MAG: poly-gamma-glutamate synthase PgsB [Tissierellia bacterium]|nr:poly-gamma-glutamate synthase PgsB [Tissierellia bacterium]
MAMRSLIAIIICIIVLIILGILEKKRNENNIKQIPLRININGIRGKSTITRLVAGVLKEAGYKVISKTTGTEARMMYWDSDEEEEIKRPIAGANIQEQLKVINKARKKGANALVCECMAVNPEYQDVYQNDMIKSNITAIVNVIEDHMDLMGPTREQIAWAFSKTIPYKGTVVIPDDEFKSYFIKEARKKKAKVKVTDLSEVSEELMNRFDYVVFPNNIAVPFAIADLLNIDREVAIRGMLKAKPDPGIVRIFHISSIYENLKPVDLVFAFAANEPISTLEIFENLKDEVFDQIPVVFINCRGDRTDRTKLFTHEFIGKIPNCKVFAMGENTDIILEAFKKGKIKNVIDFMSAEGDKEDVAYKKLLEFADGHTILGVGNIHGAGEEFFKYLDENELSRIKRLK